MGAQKLPEKLTFDGKKIYLDIRKEQILIILIEVMGCMAACFEWADSYDSKDWDRLRKCIAPTLRVRLSPIISPSSTNRLFRSTTDPSSTRSGKPCLQKNS